MPLTAIIYWESVGTLEKISVLGPGRGRGEASRGVIVKFWTLRESHLAALHFALLLTMWGEYEVMQNVSVPPPKAFQWIPLYLE